MSDIIASSANVSPSGQIHIADDVIVAIVGTAILETDGVAGMAGYFSGDFASKLSRKKGAKGVTLRTEDGKVHLTVEIVVNSGVKLQSMARDVQQKVKSEVETMTGFIVDEVHVNITGLAA